MAIAQTAIFETRPTVGNDTNGAGFDASISGAGTDFSQQNSKNSGGSNGSVTDAVGVGSTTVTSLTAAFTSVLIGNIVYFDGAWYAVTAVGSGASITVDRNTTTGTGLTLNIGGAFATIDAAYAVASLAGNRTYVKDTGAYAVTASLTLTGANQLPMYFTGYTSVRGDGGRVTWSTVTNSTPLVKFGAPGYNWIFENFAFVCTAGTPGSNFDGGLSGQSYMLRLSNCSITGFLDGLGVGYINGVHFNVGCVTIDSCEIFSNTRHGVVCSPNTLIIACKIHDNGGDGVHGTTVNSGQNSTGPICIERTAVWNNTGDNVSCEFGNGVASGNTTFLQIVNCAIGASAANGIEIAGSNSTGTFCMLIVINTVIESNTGVGIKNDSTDGIGTIFLQSNAFRNNTGGDYGGLGLAAQPSDITLTAEPFTSPGTGDFSLNSTAGGGALLKQAGFPSVLG